jgi:hypothetical protein
MRFSVQWESDDPLEMKPEVIAQQLHRIANRVQGGYGSGNVYGQEAEMIGTYSVNGPEEIIRVVFTDKDVAGILDDYFEEGEPKSDLPTAMRRAREWGPRIADTARTLAGEQLTRTVTGPNPVTLAAMEHLWNTWIEPTPDDAALVADRLVAEAARDAKWEAAIAVRIAMHSEAVAAAHRLGAEVERARYTDLIEACREHFCVRWPAEVPAKESDGIRAALAALDEDTHERTSRTVPIAGRYGSQPAVPGSAAGPAGLDHR